MGDEKTKSVYDLNLERDTFITLISKRKTGKSVLIASLCHYFMTHPDPENRCHYMYVFSKTAAKNKDTNRSYSFLDPRAIIDPENMTNVINQLLISQQKTNNQYHILLVFDDIIVTKRYAILEELASQGRHSSITVVLSSQISNHAVSPAIRANVDYIIWRRLGEDELKNNVYKYMSIADRHRDFKSLIAYTLENTTEFRFIVYNNSIESVEDKISLVRANDTDLGDWHYTIADPPPPRQKRRRNLIQW